jgi:glycine/D-amino acid oxidase-like deaminating enzyme/nitrite reductase/ring-hydroxylating ferredoxin subunit
VINLFRIFFQKLKNKFMQVSKSINEKITSGKNISFWIDSSEPITYSPLRENLSTDVVVVGGGIAGVSLAYRLTELGKRVILVEDGNICSGETGRTTAHLVTALDDRYETLEKLFGEEGARLAFESNRAAIDFVERTITKEKINCDFERLNGYLFKHPSDDPDSLDKEMAAAKRAGINVQKIPSVPGLTMDVGECLLFPDQAQFHPLKYIKGLCNAIIRNGGRIYTATHADKIDSDGITTNENFRITAEHVVIATNTPVNNKYVMHLKQFPYRTYVIAATVPKGILPEALWWDTGDHDTNPNIPPYHYVRLQKFNDTQDLLISGAEDHATGLALADVIPEENRYGLIEEWTRERFPIEEVLYHWSGQVMEPMDSLGFIGRNPWDKDNVYIITGDSGNGMTHCTIGALLISDLIAGKENKWEKLYNPSRFKIFKAGNIFFKEIFGGFQAYLKENKEEEEHETKLSEIKRGEGKIIELEKEKYGAYCDENNELHLVSAECTHLKCIVKWNNDEKSWDCPCHGSRFTYEGHVINGPANSNLSYYKESVPEKVSK